MIFETFLTEETVCRFYKKHMLSGDAYLFLPCHGMKTENKDKLIEI